jgi:hypothetical protein
MPESPESRECNAALHAVNPSEERAKELREEGRELRQRSHSLIIGIRLRTAAIAEIASKANRPTKNHGMLPPRE